MALEAGTLRVTLQYAKDIKDCDWFGRQDPYVKLRVGTQDRRSRTIRDGGRNPVWEETFEFTVINENTLDLVLMDEDTIARDDLIGNCSVSLARVRERGLDTVQEPVSSGKKARKQRGFVQLSLSFTPNSRLRPSAGAYSAPYGAYGAVPAAAPPVAATYGYPAPALSACGSCGHAVAPPPTPAPFGYGYPPQQYGPAYGPPASYGYGPSLAAPGATPPPGLPFSAPSAPPAPSQAWPPAYGAAPYGAQAPSYYPSLPSAQPAYGGYPGVAPYYRS